VRTKTTMCKRMLRTVLAVAFSAGLVLGAVSPQDLGWDSVSALSVATAPMDLGWDMAPVGADA
jgi:hypothetical protein